MHKLLEMGEPTEIDRLRQRIEELEQEALDWKDATSRAKEQSIATTRSLANLRKQLEPLHRALRIIFGELDAAGVEETPATESKAGNLQPPAREKWQAWKNQLPPSCGKVIDALLVQPLTTTQLKGICKVSYESARQAIVILTRNGLIEKDGDMNRLKRL